MPLPSSINTQGRKIGHYTVLEQIGVGGMGEVFSAVRSDGQFDQKVAIKLVRSTAASGVVLDHFRNERQILAGLDHPNIARLLDGGTTEDGTPYIVMELVTGKPIDEYCDSRKLSISHRLELFRQVCAAVQYAHQHLIVHRDIKPGNILVTEDGTPKLLDFGIARIFDASGIVAATQYRSFTPDYASPEQLRGEPLSTATDLYSLGVVLYHLLTGRSPYRVDHRAPGKLATAITKDEPERPSTSVTRAETGSTQEFLSENRETTPVLLQKRLSGDLDYILLKALRKEPELRYSSVEQFSEDLHRHLERRPVLARKGTWNYRAGKFIRRNRAAVAAAGLVTATLIAGLVVTLREIRIAE
ncbi:MAG TPA: serine/threonine-protein kinase, partial [Candidatus Acidoferrum sp.]|nr:serine/threonine-protein kinase [Candidatus Acidoferrum sp.]